MINLEEFKIFPLLETERLLFRNLTENDSEDLYTIRSNEIVLKFMDTDSLHSIDDAKNLINSMNISFQNEDSINWGIIEKTSDQLIGYFGFWRIDKKNCRGEIGYALHPNYHKMGYMKETLNIMVRYGFNKLNLHSIEANVNPKNTASIKLLEKLHFKKEAFFRENFFYNGIFLDSIIYSLLEKDLIS